MNSLTSRHREDFGSDLSSEESESTAQTCGVNASDEEDQFDALMKQVRASAGANRNAASQNVDGRLVVGNGRRGNVWADVLNERGLDDVMENTEQLQVRSLKRARVERGIESYSIPSTIYAPSKRRRGSGAYSDRRQAGQQCFDGIREISESDQGDQGDQADLADQATIEPCIINDRPGRSRLRARHQWRRNPNNAAQTEGRARADVGGAKQPAEVPLEARRTQVTNLEYDFTRSRQHIQVTAASSVQDVSRCIVNLLHEENEPLIEQVVEKIGRSLALEIVYLTEDIIASGGLYTLNGDRQRTPGGIFFYIVRQHPLIDSSIRDALFMPQLTQFKQERKEKKKEARRRKQQQQGASSQLRNCFQGLLKSTANSLTALGAAGCSDIHSGPSGLSGDQHSVVVDSHIDDEDHLSATEERADQMQSLPARSSLADSSLPIVTHYVESSQRNHTDESDNVAHISQHSIHLLSSFSRDAYCQPYPSSSSDPLEDGEVLANEL